MHKLSIKHILSGDVLSNNWFKSQYKLIVLISVLIFVYIYSGYQSQRQQRQLSELHKELQDVQMTQLTVNAELMNKCRQSSVVKMLHDKGSKLKENITPVVRVQ